MARPVVENILATASRPASLANANKIASDVQYAQGVLNRMRLVQSLARLNEVIEKAKGKVGKKGRREGLDEETSEGYNEVLSSVQNEVRGVQQEVRKLTESLSAINRAAQKQGAAGMEVIKQNAEIALKQMDVIDMKPLMAFVREQINEVRGY